MCDVAHAVDCFVRTVGTWDDVLANLDAMSEDPNLLTDGNLKCVVVEQLRRTYRVHVHVFSDEADEVGDE